MSELSLKHQNLQNILRDLAPLAVAFSGGVDSSLLLKVAHDTLGTGCCAISVDAPYHFRQELADAAGLTGQLGVRHQIIAFDPASVDGLMNNPADRCYLCKKALLARCFLALAPEPWNLVDGSTRDDQTAHRPGRRALHELNVRSPLAEAGFTKQDIRSLSKKLGLATWDKPAQSCLLTRFPHDYPILPAELWRVEHAEQGLQGLGFSVVRVRSRGDLARVECEQGKLAQSQFPLIEAVCRQAGFSVVEIDPDGYRHGSLD